MTTVLEPKATQARPPIVSAMQDIPLAHIQESKTNPRRRFDEAKLAELASLVPGYEIRVMWRFRLCCPRKLHLASLLRRQHWHLSDLGPHNGSVGRKITSGCEIPCRYETSKACRHGPIAMGHGPLSAGLLRCMLLSRPSLAKYACRAEPGPPAGLPYLKFKAVCMGRQLP